MNTCRNCGEPIIIDLDPFFGKRFWTHDGTYNKQCANGLTEAAARGEGSKQDGE